MNVKISQLESFVAVAQIRNFTQAARLLHLSQPALTVQIRQLENHLGVKLLNRNSRSVKLTEAGRELLPKAQTVVREVEALVTNRNRLSIGDKGVVRIGAISSVWASILPSAIARFRERYPGIFVEVKDVFTEEILHLVREEKVDFGIASVNDIDRDFRVSFLFRDRLNAVFAPHFSLARKSVIRLRDLVNFPLILLDPDTSTRQVVDRAFESIGDVAKPVYEASRSTTAIALAESGLGVAILSSLLFRDREYPHLLIRPIHQAMLAREFGIIQKFGHSPSAAAESFLIFLRSIRKSLRLDTEPIR